MTFMGDAIVLKPSPEGEGFAHRGDTKSVANVT